VTLLEIIVTIILILVLLYVPWASTIALFALPVWALIALIRFWRKHPSIWQMRREARRAAGTTDQTAEKK
jgi:hypothetical protein